MHYFLTLICINSFQVHDVTDDVVLVTDAVATKHVSGLTGNVQGLPAWVAFEKADHLWRGSGKWDCINVARWQNNSTLRTEIPDTKTRLGCPVTVQLGHILTQTSSPLGPVDHSSYIIWQNNHVCALGTSCCLTKHSLNSEDRKKGKKKDKCWSLQHIHSMCQLPFPSWPLM